MRISTSQIYDTGALGIQRNQSALFKLTNQISSGRKMLTPADDPVAAAQALVVTQSLAVNAQQLANQGNASDQLALVDTQLSSLTSLLQNVRDRVVQAGGGALNDSDRQTIATELESSLGEMLGIANSDNGTGDFLFSGYKGGTRPFAVDASQPVVPPATSAPVKYYGDDGQRRLQVSASRQMAVSVPGSELFLNAQSGNGSFIAAMSGSNVGTAITDDGQVLDVHKWAAAVNNPAAGKPLTISFVTNPLVVPSGLDYQITDSVGGSTAPAAYVDGQAIPLVTKNAVDFGSQVVVTGAPANGDKLTVTPSASRSVFQTMQNLIGILRSPVSSGGYTSTQFSNDLSLQLGNIDQAMSQVSEVQTTVGTNMRELDSLKSTSSDLNIDYSATLSDLQDLDYVKAFTDFSKQQVALEAAQKSFVQISGLSLFNYL